MVQGVSIPAGQSANKLLTTPTESDMYRCVGQWLQQVIPSGFDIMQGQENFVPTPQQSYVVMEIVTKSPIGTNLWSYTSGTRQVVSPTRISMQLNLFGKGSGAAVQVIQQLWRDFYTTDAMRALGNLICPLDTSLPTQAPFINAESNYEDEWTIDVRFQANITTSIPQDFATSAQVVLVEADIPTTQE